MKTRYNSVIPELLSATDAAHLLGISRSLFYNLHSAGKVPQPVKLGRRVLWRRKELMEFVAAGCPDRDRWTDMRKGGLS